LRWPKSAVSAMPVMIEMLAMIEMTEMTGRILEMSLMSEKTARPAIPARFPLTLIPAMSAAAKALLLWVRILLMEALSIVVLQEWWKPLM
jgi:hypothetical protein